MHITMSAASGHSATGSRDRHRHHSRFALECECLESRQLLSTGQPNIGTPPVGPSSPVPVNQAVSAQTQDVGSQAPGVSPQADSTLNASSGTGFASQYGTVAGVTLSQATYLINELSHSTSSIPVSQTGAIVNLPVTASGNPTNNITGENVTVSNLSVSPLNSDMTSSTAAITDTQVDSDAYLVPMSEGMLKSYLGESTQPMATHMNTAATITNTPVTTPPFSLRTPVASNAPTAVLIGGPSVSAHSGVNPPNSVALDFVEPTETEPAPQGDQGPAGTSTPALPQESAQPPSAGATTPSQGGQSPTGGSDATQAAPQGATCFRSGRRSVVGTIDEQCKYRRGTRIRRRASHCAPPQWRRASSARARYSTRQHIMEQFGSYRDRRTRDGWI